MVYRSRHGECCRRTTECKKDQLFARTQAKPVERLSVFRQLSVSAVVLRRHDGQKALKEMMGQNETEGWRMIGISHSCVCERNLLTVKQFISHCYSMQIPLIEGEYSSCNI